MVMRQYLGPRPPFDYQVERHNSQWTEHIARTNVTAGLIAWLGPGSVIDPACGDGSIVLSADRISPIERIVLADISQPNCEAISRLGHEAVVGDIMTMLSGDEVFGLVVLTEVLEHLERPDDVLKAARLVGRSLIASSPQMRPGQVDTNQEHLWMFDSDGYREMLMATGWKPFFKAVMEFPSEYDFQIWVCR
jgi:hypothetical protein